MVTPANGYYGHRKILNDYLGLPPDTPFGGVLQHGWQMGPWLATVRPWPQYVWGKRDVASIKGSWFRRATSRLIGAPFLYHPDVRVGLPAGPPDQLLALPYHGHGVDLDGAHRQYATFLEGYRGDYNGITVCLHPLDFDTEIREIYRKAGFATVTNGDRADPYFLDNLLGLLRDHGAMTTNRAATGLFYAALVGRRVFVRGPFARSASRIMKDVPYDEQFEVYERAFPELVAGIEGADARSLGQRELGAEFVRDPSELASILRVHVPARWVVTGIAKGNKLRRHAKRSKIGPKPEALGLRGERVRELKAFSLDDEGVAAEPPRT